MLCHFKVYNSIIYVQLALSYVAVLLLENGNRLRLWIREREREGNGDRRVGNEIDNFIILKDIQV